MELLFLISVGCLYGACVGSFLNVVAYRVPRKLSVIHPGSHCTSCQQPVKMKDNIPVVSYLILKGRCRHCQASYSSRYMWVELLTGLLTGMAGGLAYHLTGTLWIMGLAWFVVWAMVTQWLMTLETYTIKHL